ncbi:MAG: Ig-like domain-containing protein, partial [Phycisphaerae bacterium]
INGEAVEDRYAATIEVVELLYFANMDVNPGWTFDPGSGADRWRWGAPVGGGTEPGDPTSAYTGRYVIGYDLSTNGDYPDNLYPAQCATTPAIDCSGFEDVTLSFYRWLGVESREYDQADVWASNDGLDWVRLWSNPIGDLTDSSWVHQQLDISTVADDQPTVYVRWGMGPTDGWVSYYGWNLDDVMVTGMPEGMDVRGPAVEGHSPAGVVGLNQKAVTFTFDDAMDTAGFETADDVASFTGPTGDLLGEITGYTWVDDHTLEVRFSALREIGAYTMVIGPNVPDDMGNPMNQDGDGTNGEAVDDRYAATFEIIDALYFAGMDVDPGWSLGAGWQWGTPTGGGSGEGDPTSGYTGPNVVGYNLSGDYPNNLSPPRYATTPGIDCSQAEDVTLSFYRWLGVESSYWDHADIYVSRNGMVWQPVWTNPDDDLMDAHWSYEEYDISAVADNQPTVYVRWSMGPTDESLTYPGWNLDDVMVTCYRPPVAAEDAYHAPPGATLSVGRDEGVLANDRPSGGGLTAVPMYGPDGGDLTLHSDGSFEYEPYPDFYGPDSFVYAASDGRETSDPCTVTLNVAISGDADLNRSVDFRDYLQLKAHLITAAGATWSMGDFDCDGAVGRSDFHEMVAHFGESYSPPPLPNAPAAEEANVTASAPADGDEPLA